MPESRKSRSAGIIVTHAMALSRPVGLDEEYNVTTFHDLALRDLAPTGGEMLSAPCKLPLGQGFRGELSGRL